jgi:hypothetical protein
MRLRQLSMRFFWHARQMFWMPLGRDFALLNRSKGSHSLQSGQKPGLRGGAMWLSYLRSENQNMSFLSPTSQEA